MMKKPRCFGQNAAAVRFGSAVTLLLCGVIAVTFPLLAVAQQVTNDTSAVGNDDFVDYTLDYVYKCATPCSDGSFCGRDLTCHSYSCENWYTLAHPNMTGYTSSSSSPTLDCQVLENGQDRSFRTISQLCYDGKLPIAVSAGCRDLGSTCASYTDNDDSLLLVAHMNRKCTATPAEGFSFVCYDMAPETNWTLYFADYLAALNTTDPNDMACNSSPTGVENDDDVANRTTETYFSYPVTVMSPRFGYSDGFSSSKFNATLVSKTVIARLYSVADFPSLFSVQLCDDDGGCKDTEFCGQDGTCHAYSCVNMYEYGPKTVTGHDYQDLTAGPLECSGKLPAVDDDANSCTSLAKQGDTNSSERMVVSPWPVLIHYKCSRKESDPTDGSVATWIIYSPDDDKSQECAGSEMDGRYATFNRHCYAQPNPNQNFSCYDVDPDIIKNNDDMKQYLQNYVSKTTMDLGCAIDNLPFPSRYDTIPDNITVSYHGSHSYSTCIYSQVMIDDSDPSYIRISGGRNCGVLVDGSVGRDDSALTPIDYERLRHVMKSSISGDPPPTSPAATATPPAQSAATTTSSSPFIVMKMIVVTSALAWMTTHLT